MRQRAAGEDVTRKREDVRDGVGDNGPPTTAAPRGERQDPEATGRGVRGGDGGPAEGGAPGEAEGRAHR